MRKAIQFGLAGLLAVGMLSTAPAAFAKGGGDKGVRASGSCSASSAWKLKAKADDGKIEAEFEVHEAPRGDMWDVTLSDNGTVFFQGAKKTKGNEGHFSIEKKTANQAGTDKIDASATNQRTGETCTGSVSLG
jgi:hypothetical protein